MAYLCISPKSAFEKLGDLSSANRVEYPKTLKKLKGLIEQGKLKVDSIIAGHDTPIHGLDLIDHYLTLLENAPK